MSKWHIISIISLLGILFIIWQSPPDVLLEDSLQVVEDKPLYPSSYLVNAKTTQFNQSGEVSHVMTADRMLLYKGRNETWTEMENPSMTGYPRDTSLPPWTAVSKKGLGNEDGSEITLSDDVLITHISKTGELTTLASDSLTINPDNQYAETDKPVIIKNASGTTTATGMTLSLETGLLELLSNVRSQYEPR